MVDRLGTYWEVSWGGGEDAGVIKVTVCMRVVHTEANTRRIRVVEQCFGSNGMVSVVVAAAAISNAFSNNVSSQVRASGS